MACCSAFHHLHVQLQLESDMNETGVLYPRVISHVKKTGFTVDRSCANSTEVSNQKNSEAIASTKMKALYDLEELGISVKDKNGKWLELPLKEVSDLDDNVDNDEEEDEDDCTDDEDKTGKEEIAFRSEQESGSVSKEELQEDAPESVSKEELQKDVL